MVWIGGIIYNKETIVEERERKEVDDKNSSWIGIEWIYIGNWEGKRKDIEWKMGFDFNHGREKERKELGDH